MVTMGNIMLLTPPPSTNKTIAKINPRWRMDTEITSPYVQSVKFCYLLVSRYLTNLS